MRSSPLKMLLLLLLPLLITFAPASHAQETKTVTVLEKPGLTTTIISQHVTNVPTTSLTPSTSVAHTTQSQAVYVAASSAPADDGASGSSSAFDLSTGGMIAIIVVVVAVVIFGVVSTVLFVIAKRRQWKIRDSIKRASRRLTGRRSTGPRKVEGRRRGPSASARKTENRSGTTVAHPPGQKHGLAVEVKDVEKGHSDTGASEQRAHTWGQRLRGNNWV